MKWIQRGSKKLNKYVIYLSGITCFIIIRNKVLYAPHLNFQQIFYSIIKNQNIIITGIKNFQDIKKMKTLKYQLLLTVNTFQNQNRSI